MKPILLCILDGVGIREERHGNAVKMANKPNFDYLWENYPHSLLEASGTLVGLPEGQMGNSEVGHMNIGSGRIVFQPLEMINEKIRDKSFFTNEELLKVMDYVKAKNSRLQIFGLLSDGGIHSHINHLLAIIDLAKKEGIKEVYYHLFLDGRDTLKDVALNYINILEAKIKATNLGSISTIAGRYYAMDRDNRWDRIKKAYDAITLGEGEHYASFKECLETSYQKGVYDEFIVPAVFDKKGTIKENDGLILFNFRPDRVRELFSALTNENFNAFPRPFIKGLKLVTMMPVSSEVICTNAYQHIDLSNTLGDFLANHNYTQLRIAETEKYAHVTYFFDGGFEMDLKGCTRILIPSPKVATYDLKPEMSAYEITDTLLKELDKNVHDVIILNYANGDMVGHTGNLKATIKAIEVLDECLGKLYKKIKEKNGLLIVTADHGNSDYMLDENDNIVTSHSTSLVPFIVTDNNYTVKDGKLGDIAPTILTLLEEKVPVEMTGEVLVTKKS